MKDWLKNNPFAQMAINGIITLAVMLLMFNVTKHDTTNANTVKKLQELESKKASVSYVDRENDKQDKRMEIANQSFKQDLNEIKKDQRSIINLLVDIKKAQ